MEEKEKTQRTIIHLFLKEKGEDFYFGSLKAIYDRFNEKEIGISYRNLRNKGIKVGKKVFENEFCIIKKGILESTPTNRGRKKKEGLE